MSDSPANATFTCSINLNYSGIMTLNGLSNGYKSPPSGSNGNPPVVATVIQGPTVVNAFVAAGGMNYYASKTGTTSEGYSDSFTYNLPDGSLFTLSFTITGLIGTYTLSKCKYNIVPKSDGTSLFQIVNDSVSGLTISLTIQMQQN
ncbi:MAG: hypothetical protein ACRCYO_15430 [Bacteroidia bacterium]